MMSRVIVIEDLWKEYRLGVIGYGTLREDLQSWWARCRGKEDPNLPVGYHGGDNDELTDTIFALKDLWLEVQQGEILGLIGPNGAGKTTLLKIITGMTAPTRGTIKMNGRVASLLAVGTGMHPELTGRENVFLNGAILGMTRAEIRRKFDEIVDFSGVEQFIDTPVKRYSSGMNVRLGFAVAAHLEPEILLVDEVLAVGDAAFQRKCMGKMEEVSGSGRTILFVSHRMSAISTLCDRCVVLDRGGMAFDGPTHDAVRTYLEMSFAGEDNHKASFSFDPDPSLPAELIQGSIVNESGEVSNSIPYQEDFEVRLNVVVHRPDPAYYAVISLQDMVGHAILTTADDDLGPSPLAGLERGVCTIRVRFAAKMLKPGRYHLHCSLTRKRSGAVDSRVPILVLNIEDSKSWRARHEGYRSATVVAPEIPWEYTVDKR